MDTRKAAATIHQTGGGTGMTYEFLRPHGAMVSSARVLLPVLCRS